MYLKYLYFFTRVVYEYIITKNKKTRQTIGTSKKNDPAFTIQILVLHASAEYTDDLRIVICQMEYFFFVQ